MAKLIVKLGDDISTDVIYPDRYMGTGLPTETPQFAFADNAELNGKLKSKHVPPGLGHRRRQELRLRLLARAGLLLPEVL